MVRHRPAAAGDWSNFHSFLLQRMNAKTAGDRLRYAKQFVHILQSEDAQSLLQLQPAKRIHAMKALASLARFTGEYDRWMKIRESYNLKWSAGNETLTTFQRFFSDNMYNTVDKMLEWVHQAISVLPASMASTIKLNVLTGLRPIECIHAMRLLNRPETFSIYYNQDKQALEHFRFPEIFIRRTKCTYISIITKEQLSAIGVLACKTPTPNYDTLRFAVTRKGLDMHMAYCRKIFASHLRHAGFEPEVVNLLQGRVSKDILTRHYLVPNESLRYDIIASIEKLREKL